ncbi:hypothetical protein FNV43_RR15374 [Rhamnella rubrinervis]|uniref:Pentatricopeptide repeat-containing protein n=1 Tax=Rhamnella rubrinervis TaxID=2594499 RepID=A0A8K0GYB1_9ROSA|nr:hypothetical protein FNV43_RR15374 [Rhamnella rubrinervis]
MAFYHMVDVLTRITERYETVKGIILELEKLGCVPKAQTFLILLRVFWHGGMNDMVFEAFELMRNYGFEPNTFAQNAIMDILFKIHRVDAAVGVLKEIQFPNFLTFSIALCNLCNLKDLFLIGDTFRMMLKMGYYPNVEIFEMVLNSFCKMGKLMEAYQVLGLIIASGVPLTVNVWSILIDGFCRIGRLDIAINLLEKMVEIGFSPTVVIYTTLIKGFLKSHMVNDAFDILRTMESRGHTPDLVLHNVLIDCLAKVGRHDDAIKVFVGLVKQKIVPDSYTFCSLLSAICMSRKFSLLPKLVRGHLKEADLKLYNSLINYSCKAGFPSFALKLYDDMVDRGLTPDKYTFAGLLSGLCGARKIALAIDVYHGIVRTYPDQDPHVHTVVIHWLVKVGVFHAAVRLFREAVAGGYPLDVASYTVAIHGLFKGCRTAEACSLFNQMKNLGLAPNAYTYNVMLSGFFKERDVKMVKEMLQEMIDARMKLNCYNSFMLFNLLHRSDQFISIIGLLVEMRDLELIPAKANVLLFNQLGQGVHLEDESHSTWMCYFGNELLFDTSGSEDLSDVAASVG